jgi:hypothetical protein
MEILSFKQMQILMSQGPSKELHCPGGAGKKARSQTSALIISALSFCHSRVRGGGAKKEAFMMRRRVILELERADIKGTCTTHTYIGPDQLHSRLPTEP